MFINRPQVVEDLRHLGAAGSKHFFTDLQRLQQQPFGFREPSIFGAIHSEMI